MNELIQLLNKVNNREIPVSSTVSQDLLEVIQWSKNRPISKETVRQYLIETDRYETEEDLDLFMRDLFTIYAVVHEQEHRNQISNLVKSTVLTGGVFVPNNNTVRELINSGFRCYPVTYSNEGMVLGIITKVGHIVIA